MTEKIQDEFTVVPSSPDKPADDSWNWLNIGVTALLGAFITLLALSPMGYILYRNMPPRVATVDLQRLVEDDQKRMLDVIGKGGIVTNEQRAVAEKLTIDFAKKLSGTVDALGQECRCVIVNKAALLGGVTIDYTDAVRERMKQ